MAAKSTEGKLKLNLVPNNGLEAVARVREFGCEKYPGKPNDYLDQVKVSDLVEACRRHLLKHQKGELLDSESLEMHLAHVATSAMMAMEILYIGMEVDELTLREMQAIHAGLYESSTGQISKWISHEEMCEKVLDTDK